MAERLGAAVALLLCSAGCIVFEEGGGSTAAGGAGGGGAGGSALIDGCAPGDPTGRCAAGERCTWSETERVTDAGRERARLVCAAGGPREELQRCTTDEECGSLHCAPPCPDCPRVCLAPCSTNTQCPASFRCEAGLLRGESAQFCVPFETTSAAGVACHVPEPGTFDNGCTSGTSCDPTDFTCVPQGAPGRPSSLCDDDASCPVGEACVFRAEARGPDDGLEQVSAMAALCLPVEQAPAPFRRCDFDAAAPACESGFCQGFCSEVRRPICSFWHCTTPCGTDDACPFPAVCQRLDEGQYGRRAPASIGRCSLDRLCLSDADCDAPKGCAVALRGPRLITECLERPATKATGEACAHAEECRTRACVAGTCRAPCLATRDYDPSVAQADGACSIGARCLSAVATVPVEGTSDETTAEGTFCLPP